MSSTTWGFGLTFGYQINDNLGLTFGYKSTVNDSAPGDLQHGRVHGVARVRVAPARRRRATAEKREVVLATSSRTVEGGWELSVVRSAHR